MSWYGYGYGVLRSFITIFPVDCDTFCLDASLLSLGVGSIFVTFILCIALLGLMLSTVVLFIF
jgi:hypothetical protein